MTTPNQHQSLRSALLAILTLAAVAPAAHAQAPTTIDAVAPGTVLSPATPSAVIPIRLTRGSVTTIAGASVTFHLTNLSYSGSTLGGFLGADGANVGGPYLTNLGGGNYTLDAASLGLPCGTDDTNGTLFSVTVTGTSGTTGSLTITQVKLRDCTNGAVAAAIGTAASLDIDYAGPAITSCAPDQTGAAGGFCQADVPDFRTTLSASDAHGPLTITQTPAPGTVVPLGATPISFTLADNAGNTSSCAATFTATDQTPPSISAPAAVSVASDAGQCGASGVSLGTPVTSDNCGVQSVTSNAPATFPGGTTVVTWTVTDVHGLTATATQNVTVTDTQFPAIAGVSSNLNVPTGPAAVSCGTTATWTAPTATDNCPGVTLTTDHAPGSSFPLGSTLVTYTATDAAGHVTTRTFTVTVADNTAPAVAMTSPNGGESWMFGSVHTVSWSGSDNCTLATYDLELSTDNGSSWSPVVTAQPYAAGYAWTVPATATTGARLRVTVRDAAGNVTTDPSDAVFTVRSANLPPTLAHIGNIVCNEQTLLTFTASGADADAGQTLTYSLDPGFPAGAAIGANSGVFTWTPAGAQSPGVYTVTVRVTDNGTPAMSTFETFTITVNDVSLAAVKLESQAIAQGNDADGTIKIHLTWPTLPAGTTLAIYRRGFGAYPEYDDAGGSAPPAPTSFPPGAGWALVTNAPGTSYDDDVAWPARDDYFYVGYVRDTGANHSPPSEMTYGLLNYRLGDVMNPSLPAAENGHGDNVVNLSDISLLGAHYGLAGAAVAAYNYLDVGPTTTANVDGRPMTDNSIDFEDLMIFALDYDLPPVLMTSGGSRGGMQSLATARELHDRVYLDAPVAVVAGQTYQVHVRMAGSDDVQGVSVGLRWDPAVVQPGATVTGGWLQSQNGVAMSPRAGAVDAVLLGSREKGLSGEGDLAVITFTALTTGTPRIGITTLLARDAMNHPMTMATPLAVGSPGLASQTALSALAPNPFRTTAQFVVSLAEAGAMDVSVYSVDGRRVRTLASGERAAGQYHLTWDGNGETGSAMSGGVYFVRLHTPAGYWVRTVALLK